MNREWLQLRDATRRARISQNAVYRLGALGKVRTRVGPRGFLEFLGEDLDGLVREKEKAQDQPRGRRGDREVIAHRKPANAEKIGNA